MLQLGAGQYRNRALIKFRQNTQQARVIAEPYARALSRVEWPSQAPGWKPGIGLNGEVESWWNRCRNDRGETSSAHITKTASCGAPGDRTRLPTHNLTIS